VSARPWLEQHLDELSPGLDWLREAGPVVDDWGRVLAGVLGAGGRLLAAGNGGSAAEAQHLTAELVGRFVGERRPLSALCLSAETSSLTAIVNDYGADEVFARQVQAHGRPGDVLLLLSTSGRSPNLLRAAERATQAGVTVWALTGPAPNPLADMADAVLAVEAASTSAVQEVHLVAVHALCAAVDQHLAKEIDLRAPQTTGWAVPSAGPAPARPQRAGRASRGRPHVVVVGDLLLDVDVDGRVERICPDAPVPVVDVAGRLESPGGAGLTALLCTQAGAAVTLVAPVAEDAGGQALRALLEGEVDLVALGHDGGTRTKTRVRCDGQTLLRLDSGGTGAPTGELPAGLAELLETADVVLVSDYGAGTTSHPSLRGLLQRRAAAGGLVWDPHPRGGAPVPRCTLVTPNLSEARAAAGGPAGAAHAPEELARTLAGTWSALAACVTVGSSGAYLHVPGSEALYVPATAVAGGDPCGAGDRFAATAAVSLARGAVLSEAVVDAVAAASAWVASGGAAAFRAERENLPGSSADQDRDHDPGAVRTSGAVGQRGPSAADLVRRVRADGGRVVATGGCFDVLHAGHVACLQAARGLGDALVVLLNSDASVRRAKGRGRPVVSAQDRARVLLGLGCVDAVEVFDEDDPGAALERLRPDVWAKGGDYGGAVLPEAEVVRRHGGRVVLLPYLDGRSSSKILSAGNNPHEYEEIR